MSKLILILAILFSFPLDNYGQKNENPTHDKVKIVSDNTKLDSSLATIQPPPKKTQAQINSEDHKSVFDFEKLLPRQQRNYLDSIISQFEKKNNVEIVILTLNALIISQEDFDSSIIAMHQNFAIARKNKGNLITIGISASFKKSRIISVNNNKLILSNQETKKIIDNIIIPQFNQGYYFEGFKEALTVIMSKVH